MIHPVLTAFFVLSASVLLEVLQGALTRSRRVEPWDFVENGIGIACGLVLVLMVGLVIDVVSRRRKNRPNAAEGAR